MIAVEGSTAHDILCGRMHESITWLPAGSPASTLHCLNANVAIAPMRFDAHRRPGGELVMLPSQRDATSYRPFAAIVDAKSP
jgi:hypothetical protein